ERGPASLAVDLDLEAAHPGRERDAAARELRRADRALAGAARALLAPRLRAAARDEPAALRAAGPATRGVELRADCLVDEMRLHLGLEDLCVEREVLRRAAEHGRLGGHQRSTVRISTSPLFGPGTEPRTRRRFRSASISWTTRPGWVTRWAPMWPAIFLPLNTRDGVADAPTEPGLRMLCEPLLIGPRLKLCRLIVPWNPLPIEIPETLMRSP